MAVCDIMVSRVNNDGAVEHCQNACENYSRIPVYGWYHCEDVPRNGLRCYGLR